MPMPMVKKTSPLKRFLRVVMALAATGAIVGAGTFLLLGIFPPPTTRTSAEDIVEQFCGPRTWLMREDKQVDGSVWAHVVLPRQCLVRLPSYMTTLSKVAP